MVTLMNYNRLKLIECIAATVVVVMCLVSLLPGALPESLSNIVRIAGMFVFIFIAAFTLSSTRNAEKIMTDELSMQNEARATQATLAVLASVLFVGLILTMLNDSSELTVSYDLLFSMIIGMVAVKDAAYLILENRGRFHADLED